MGQKNPLEGLFLRFIHRILCTEKYSMHRKCPQAPHGDIIFYKYPDIVLIFPKQITYYFICRQSFNKFRYNTLQQFFISVSIAFSHFSKEPPMKLRGARLHPVETIESPRNRHRPVLCRGLPAEGPKLLRQRIFTGEGSRSP